jgi:DinB family protein
MNSQTSPSRELPPDLKAILDDLDKSDAEARRIIGGLSDAQANWQPRESAWSIAQCLDHLARGNALYAGVLRAAVGESRAATKLRRGPIQPGWLSGIFIRSLEPPPKTKMRAPKKIVPASRANKDEVLQAFLRSQEEMRDVIRESADLDLNRIRFRNPFFGFLRFTVGAGLMIIAAHDRRHLWQAEHVRRFSGFPVQ